MKERVAILGGGQLGYFLCKAAHALDLETVVIAPDTNPPAGYAADETVQGGFDSAEWLSMLAIQDATITFELEAIDPEVLARLEGTGNAATIAQARVLKLLQDKTVQKQWLNRHEFLTSKALLFTGERHLAAEFASMHGYPIVQKVARGGYDGQGVQILRSEDDLDGLWEVPGLVEAFVPYTQELTVLVARGLDGEVVGYEPVATYFNDEGQVLDHLIAPAPIDADLVSRARLLAEAVIDALEGVGIYAVELFLTEDNQLLVNEISARVHNAGHHTLEATETSQYEQHLRAITGKPLGSTTSRGRIAVMRNLLNGIHPLGDLDGNEPHERHVGSAVLHWYGKSADRHLRKVGHITAVGDTLEEAWSAIHAVEEQLKT